MNQDKFAEKIMHLSAKKKISEKRQNEANHIIPHDVVIPCDISKL